MRRLLVLVTLAAASLGAGCLDFLTSATSPTTYTANTLYGTWASVASNDAVLQSCTGFQWSALTVSSTGASGTFTATCYGTLNITGTATGTLGSDATSIVWSSTATATAAGYASCPITLSGTASFDSITQIRIPYSGTTCLGQVSGTEILRKGN